MNKYNDFFRKLEEGVRVYSVNDAIVKNIGIFDKIISLGIPITKATNFLKEKINSESFKMVPGVKMGMNDKSVSPFRKGIITLVKSPSIKFNYSDVASGTGVEVKPSERYIEYYIEDDSGNTVKVLFLLEVGNEAIGTKLVDLQKINEVVVTFYSNNHILYSNDINPTNVILPQNSVVPPQNLNEVLQNFNLKIKNVPTTAPNISDDEKLASYINTYYVTAEGYPIAIMYGTDATYKFLSVEDNNSGVENKNYGISFTSDYNGIPIIIRQYLDASTIVKRESNQSVASQDQSLQNLSKKYAKINQNNIGIIQNLLNKTEVQQALQNLISGGNE